MAELGFKRLSVENFFESDLVQYGFVSVSQETDQAQPLPVGAWLDTILGPELSDSVPLEIRRLFEVARGTLAYGYLFYPLMTLGVEQSQRVLETALRHRCRALNAPPNQTSNFAGMVEWLHRHGHVTDEMQDQMDAIRQLRNRSSHPEDQMILPPGMAVPVLAAVVALINEQFT